MVSLLQLSPARCENSGFDPLDPHGHSVGAHAAHGPESRSPDSTDEEKPIDLEEYHWSRDDTGMTQAIGLAILEFGVVLHRQVWFQDYSHVN